MKTDYFSYFVFLSYSGGPDEECRVRNELNDAEHKRLMDSCNCKRFYCRLLANLKHHDYYCSQCLSIV